jgi:F0F1-type ATP synthase assembly protein I
VQTKQGWDLADDGLPDHQVENAKVVGLAAGLGCSVVASLVVFVGLGIFLDQWLDKTPLFTLIGVAIGLIAAGYQLYELVLVSDKNRKSGPIGRTMAQRLESRQRNKNSD